MIWRGRSLYTPAASPPTKENSPHDYGKDSAVPLGLASPVFNAGGIESAIAEVPKGRLIGGMSYVSSYFHCIFSTKERRRLITPPLQERLWPFLGGIARQNKMTALAIGGIEDHIHILLSLPSTMPIAKAMQLIKGCSSKWIHDTFPEHRLFAWQEKYGAFSVSFSEVDKITAYIKNQPEHHRVRTFQEEFLILLEKHRIKYDERYLWD